MAPYFYCLEEGTKIAGDSGAASNHAESTHHTVFKVPPWQEDSD